MTRKPAAKSATVEDILSKTAGFVKREANATACCIPMNDREYWQLVGKDFMDFFSVNQLGTSEQYQWETRRVDHLRNLWIWRKR